MSLEIFGQQDFEFKTVKNKSSTTIRKSKKTFFEDGTFTVTDIKQAIKNQNRVNIFINGKYHFSLDVFQLSDLNVKIGQVFNKDEISNLEQQSEFGKLYSLALNYCLMRPHSEKEIRDYLRKKTLTKKLRNRKTGEIYEKKGVSSLSVDQTITRLKQKKYIDDERFARFWVENRNQRKGISVRKLKAELSQKGVSVNIQEKIFAENLRSDADEIKKIIEKKSRKYPDKQKLISYLARQGFSFDEIKKALNK